VELREVAEASIWGNLTYAEIAELVGTSLSTVQRRYEQGVENCKQNPRPEWIARWRDSR
jgi:DNA-directed RNA polymerase specialized sigma24 family protein